MFKLTKNLGIVVASMLLLASCGGKNSYEYPFQNPKLSIDERVEDLLSRLTPEDKIGLMMNGSTSVDNLGIPAYNWWSEACHGICATGATVYPQAIALAATFDADQQLAIYETVSDEARARWNTTDHEQFGKTTATGGIWNQGLSFWCPNINIFRDPRWGRGQETNGEDPYLSAVMGSQVVKGMQGNDPKYLKTHACAKHYAVHSGPEKDRHRYDAVVSMRDLWDTYLSAFKVLVKDAKVQEVMCAYNRYEGEPCCGSGRLLTDILRNKWGYEDLIVSDCGAINNFYTKGQHETHPDAATASADAVLVGTDIECGTSYTHLVESLEKGLIKETDLDVSVRRILRARFELGMHDPKSMDPWANLGADDISSEAHHQLAIKAARESIVLLKNNGTLPLAKTMKIAVVGPNADDASMQNGNYSGTPTAEHTLSIINAIRQAAPNAEITYDKVCELVDPYLTVNRLNTLNGGKGLHAEYYNNQKFEGDAVASADYVEAISLRTMGDYRFAEGVNATDFSAKYSGSFTADYTGDMYYILNAMGGVVLTVNGKEIVNAVENPNARRSRGNQVPTTKFSVVKGQTYNVELSYTKAAEGNAFISFNLCERRLPDYQVAAAKAKDADVIVVVGGLSARLEGEEMPVSFEGFDGGDRVWIELPATQKQLLAAMDATGKPVVFVNCSGSAIAFADVENQYDALVQAWYGGEGAGIALADVLFGDYNPAGRLPVTFYASTKDLPDFYDYSMNERTYRYFTGKPLYAFGYGLSYTTFAYGDAKISKASVKADAVDVDVTVPVSNTGSRDGDEVVQIYIKALNNPDAPIKSLEGFKRVNVKAGETANVTIKLGAGAFEFYDEAIDELSVKPGKYQILVGSSSNDSDLKAYDFEVI